MKRTLLTLTALVATLTAGLGIASAQLSPSALRVLGQPDLRQRGFNSVGGAELFSPGGVAVDERDGAVHVYVADSRNNRVLAWRDMRSLENGAAADIALGQPSLRHTNPNGIGSRGLNVPTALAIDSATGDLYVADTDNNRVVRFLNPFDNPARVEPDKVFGQADFSETRANRPFRSARSLSAPAALRFDAAGNLWVADGGNHRILRYPADQLQADLPEADVALGQADFDFGAANGGEPLGPAGFNLPVSLAFHPDGSLYAADFNNARILIFSAPFTTGQEASSVLGQPDFESRSVSPTISATYMRGPNGLHIDAAGNLFVAVSAENRVLVFDDVAASGFGLSPATRALGQPLLTSDSPNVGAFPAASAAGLFGPGDLTGDSTGVIYVVDTNNHRLVAYEHGTSPAFAVLGQPDFARNGPNRIGPDSLGDGQGVVIDYATEGFPLYVSDTSNNRVLGWNSSLRFSNGAPADLVIGQGDFVTAIANADTGRAQSPTSTSLAGPRGLAVDSDGNLWVADSANNRVLRFPRPFEQSGRVTADVVLGQPGFFTSISAAVNASSLRTPNGVAVGLEGQVYVADTGNNRILEYPANPSTGAAAVRVFGQTAFDTGAAPTQVSAQTLSSPTGLVVDPFNFLVVADSAANRVVIYPLSGDAPATAVSASTVIGQPEFGTSSAGGGAGQLDTPRDVGVGPDGSIFVADSNNHRILTYPSLFSLPSAGGEATQVLGQRDLTSGAANFNSPDGLATNAGLFQPIGLFVDRRGMVWLGDAGNSRLLNFVGVAVGVNAATFTLGQGVAPGSLISLFGAGFSDEDAVATAIPLPTELAERSIEVNDEFRAGLLFVSPGQINLQIPPEAPTGVQRISVRRADTDEVIAGGPVSLDPVSPGLFTVSQDGRGQLLALNQDGTINSPANPAPKGSVLQLFGTGQGPTNPAVAAGQPAPSGPLAQTLTSPATSQLECLSPGFTCVAFSSKIGEVLFSGLAPGFVGLWQINVKIPADFPDALVSDTVPVRVFISQRPTNNATIAIR